MSTPQSLLCEWLQARFVRSIAPGAPPTDTTKKSRSSDLRDSQSPDVRTSGACLFTREERLLKTAFIPVGLSASRRVTIKPWMHLSDRLPRELRPAPPLRMDLRRSYWPTRPPNRSSRAAQSGSQSESSQKWPRDARELAPKRSCQKRITYDKFS